LTNRRGHATRNHQQEAKVARRRREGEGKEDQPPLVMSGPVAEGGCEEIGEEEDGAAVD